MCSLYEVKIIFGFVTYISQKMMNCDIQGIKDRMREENSYRDSVAENWLLNFSISKWNKSFFLSIIKKVFDGVL